MNTLYNKLNLGTYFMGSCFGVLRGGGGGEFLEFLYSIAEILYYLNIILKIQFLFSYIILNEERLYKQ